MNEIWAYQLVDALIAQGVDYFCCAPGSRSTPLTLAIANHPKAQSVVHFDERALCFHAVGYGKATRKPAAVVVTSGTAVGNLMPAIMEAGNDRVPMIVLTADRPPELRDCGANQTCDQVKLFQSFVRWQVDLPCPGVGLSEGYLASAMTHAVAMSTYPPAGPVHLNCMFREPLFSIPAAQCSSLQQHVAFSPPVLHPSEDVIQFWAETLSVKRQGVILVGSCSSDISETVFTLARALQWPIFADALSSLRGSESISFYDPILKLKNTEAADAVIQFGDRLTSKTLMGWLERQTLEFFLHVSDHPMRQDPAHLVTHRVLSCPKVFTKQLLILLTEQGDNHWLLSWQEWDMNCHRGLSQFFSEYHRISEPGLIWELNSIVSENWCLFVGNSMPVRDANQFFSPRSAIIRVFGNRGVSGIDGNIATICGIAKGSERPLLAVIGDLTLMHDITSLVMLSKSEYPIVLCVVNNGGGGIFSFLPISKRQEAFEEFIAASHEITFAHAASLFGIDYFHPETLSALQEVLLQKQKTPKSCLIEITTDRTENVHLHEQILSHLSRCLNAANLPVEIPTTLH